MSHPFSIISKISCKSVTGKKIKAPEDGIAHIMQVVGVATGVKNGESDKGPWTALIGSFQAINLDTGKVYRSGICFLPNVALNLITPKLMDEKTNGVEFGFIIGVKADEDSTVGYIYTADPVFETSENDPLEMLTKKLPKPSNKVAEIEHKKKA